MLVLGADGKAVAAPPFLHLGMERVDTPEVPNRVNFCESLRPFADGKCAQGNERGSRQGKRGRKVIAQKHHVLVRLLAQQLIECNSDVTSFAMRICFT